MGQGFDESFQRQLASQSWTLYGIGMFVIIVRTFARWRRVGHISDFAPDDWLMISLVPIWYTTLIVCLNVTAAGGGSNLYPPEQFSEFTEEDIQDRIKGSKLVVLSEQAMLNVIWTLKASMLFMYGRMISGTTHQKWIKYLGIYVAIGWVAMQITFFTACRPFKGYWGMPPPDPQCTTFEHYAEVQAVFNLTSDFCMLLIPVPMLASLKLPLKQKLILGVVFSMGLFVIIAAILTKVYNLSDIYSTVYMLWYVRESSVAVYVANLPAIWPLLREHIRFLRNKTSSYADRERSSGLPQYGAAYGASSTLHHNHHRNSRKPAGATKLDDEIELGRASFSKSMSRSINKTCVGDSDSDLVIQRGSLESDERALNEGAVGNGGWGKGLNFDVHVNTTIEVTRSSSYVAGSVREKDRERDSLGAGNSKERYDWEVETAAPKVRIEGPEGEVREK